MSKKTNCKNCNAEIEKSEKTCSSCGAKNRKPIYTRWWAWVIAFIVVFIIAVNMGNDKTITDKSQNPSTASQTNSPTPIQSEAPKTNSNVPAEYKSALKKADLYANSMHMSKAGLYNQLTSEYGEKFSKEAAQYAIDNVKTDWKANALAKAKTYQDSMSMSPKAIHEQLTSEYGEKFTKEEADYAIEHLNE